MNSIRNSNWVKAITCGVLGLVLAAPALADNGSASDALRPVRVPTKNVARRPADDDSRLPRPKVTELATKCQSLAGRYGPYATIDRANQVAAYFRSLGYNTSIFYGGSLYAGTRTYSVDVW